MLYFKAKRTILQELNMKDKICPITGKPCITGECSTYECNIEKKIENEEGKIVDAINGFSLEIAKSYGFRPEQTLKLAENISRRLLERLKSK